MCCAHSTRPFCKVAAFAPLRYARCNDRCAPCGFAERGVMSCAPPRLPLGRCAAMLNSILVCPRATGTSVSVRRCAQASRQLPRTPARPGVMACGLALRCSFPAGHACLPRPPPRGLPSQGYGALLRRLRHGRYAAAPQGNGNAKARSASGASRRVVLHRMRKRVSSHAVKGPLRRCAPLTEQAPAGRDQAAKKTACLRACAQAKMRFQGNLQAERGIRLRTRRANR
jgi:hypothetical protein